MNLERTWLLTFHLLNFHTISSVCHISEHLLILQKVAETTKSKNDSQSTEKERELPVNINRDTTPSASCRPPANRSFCRSHAANRTISSFQTEQREQIFTSHKEKAVDTFDNLHGCCSETNFSNISNSDRASRHFQSNEYTSTSGYSDFDKEYQNTSLNASENSDRTMCCQEDRMTRYQGHVHSSMDEIYESLQNYRKKVLGIDSVNLYSDNHKNANNSLHVTNDKECNQTKNLVSDITSYVSQSSQIQSACHQQIATMSQQQRIGTQSNDCIDERVHEHSLQTSIQSTSFALQDVLPTSTYSNLTLTSSSLSCHVSADNTSDTGLDNPQGLSFHEHAHGSDAIMGPCVMLRNQNTNELDENINSSCVMSIDDHAPMSHSNMNNTSAISFEELPALEENRKRYNICEVCHRGKGRYKRCSGCNMTLHIECHVPKLEEIPEYVYW